MQQENAVLLIMQAYLFGSDSSLTVCPSWSLQGTENYCFQLSIAHYVVLHLRSNALARESKISLMKAFK